MKKIVERVSSFAIITFLFFSVFASLVSAHVTVNPSTSTTGAWETYTVKVPVEKEVPTTKFTLKIPSDVEFMSYQPVSGWNLTTQKDDKGKVTAVTFEASGDGILPGQFQQFVITAKNPDQTEKAAWDAYQYYKDGSVVEWTGDEGAKTPHSITNIVNNQTQMNGMIMPETKETKKTDASSNDNSSLPLIISIAALLLSLVSLILAVRKKQ